MHGLRRLSLLALIGSTLAAPVAVAIAISVASALAIAPTPTPAPTSATIPPEEIQAQAQADALDGVERAIAKGPYSGDATYYDPGLGACGHTNSGSQLIVAVSHKIFDSFPGANPTNPNKNPICGKKLKATYGSKSITLSVADRCPGCAAGDLDMTRAGFGVLASLDKGRLPGVKWAWV
ncbi:expansin family protein [Mycena amicta]|nr:expansin family protein [Mycena amicta]